MDNARIGSILVLISLLLLPTMMMTLEWWDEVRLEHEAECNPMRKLDIDWEYCDELKDESSRRMSIFGLTVFAFVLTGVSGLVNILPEGESNHRGPPPGRY